MLQNHAQLSVKFIHIDPNLSSNLKRIAKCLGKLVGISAPSPAYLSVQGCDACNDLLNVKDEGENRKGHERSPS